jgi:hypothetical protein
MLWEKTRERFYAKFGLLREIVAVRDSYSFPGDTR